MAESAGCAVTDDAKWASNAQQAASITFVLLFIAGALAFWYFRPKGVEIPRRVLGLQLYIAAAIGEAIVMGFGVAYMCHLAPCFWSACHSEAGDSSLAPAYILIVSWPLITVSVVATRYMGYEQLSLWHLDRVAGPVAFEQAQVSAEACRIFALPSFGLSMRV